MDKIKYLTEKIKDLTVEIDIIREDLSQCSLEDFEKLNLSIANLNERVDELGESLNVISNKLPTVESDISNLKNNISSAEQKIQSCEKNITKNTADIAQNTSNISQNTADITQNATNISSNSAKIAQNTSDIESNRASITKNSQDISTNTQNISTNIQNISANSANISANAQNIASNTQNIANNTQSIAENTQNIANNTRSIAENAQNIASNTQSINNNSQNISINTQNISKNTQNISTNASNIVKLTEKCNSVEDAQASLSTSLDSHINDFLVERAKLQNVTGAFYGENLLENPFLTCNQRGASTNQTTSCFMHDRWYKCCTNEVKVYLRTDGQFELRFLKALTSPVRIIEQRIDLPVTFHKRDIVISAHIMNCTSYGENSTCFGAEYFNSSGESLGVIIYPVNSTGIKVLPAYIPNGTTSITFFYQANANVTRGSLIRFKNPKIEFGTVASKFGGRSNDYEMRLCYKYYYTTGVSEENPLILKAISETEFESNILYFPTTMARVPDITLFGPGGVQNMLSCEEGEDSIAVSAVPLLDGIQCFKIIATNAVAGRHYKLCGYTADAELVPQNITITDNPDPISIW